MDQGAAAPERDLDVQVQAVRSRLRLVASAIHEPAGPALDRLVVALCIEVGALAAAVGAA